MFAVKRLYGKLLDLNLNITMRIIIFFLLSFNCHSAKVSCEEESKGLDSTPSPEPLFDVTSPFEFKKQMPSIELGIFPTIIVQMEFKRKQRTYLWRTNTAFMNDELRSVMEELCNSHRTTTYSETEGDYLHWGNCTFTDTQITALLEQGTGDTWNKNFTYFEIIRRPFTQIEGAVESTCILNSFRERKVYVVLMSNIFSEGDVPIYKLDSFMPFARSFFEEIIDIENIKQFYPMDYLHPKPLYKCLLGIVSGESVEDLKLNCQFQCTEKKHGVENYRDEL